MKMCLSAFFRIGNNKLYILLRKERKGDSYQQIRVFPLMLFAFQGRGDCFERIPQL